MRVFGSVCHSSRVNHSFEMHRRLKTNPVFCKIQIFIGDLQLLAITLQLLNLFGHLSSFLLLILHNLHTQSHRLKPAQVLSAPVQ